MLVEGKTVAAPAAGTTAKELLERVCPELM